MNQLWESTRVHFQSVRACLLLASIALLGCPDEQTENRTDPQWVVQQEPRADVAVVFVHGIFGDTLGTWTYEGGPAFFDLLNQHETVAKKTDMFAFGFTSNMWKSGSFDIQEAANTLYQRMKFEKLLDYPALVFVAHSMGGLVVLRALLTQREILPQARLIMLFATPQEGAQITTIARHVANNPALEQMLPQDRNSFLRVLDDEWKALPARPLVRCAYEKRPTHGVEVVPRSSATRFCDGAPVAIDADHIGIVKPRSKNDDSVVVLVNALNETVVGKQLTAKLELPDLQELDGNLLLTMNDAKGRRDVRIVNAGGTALRFTLAEFPDRGLYVMPGPGPTQVAANATHLLQFVLGFGATDSEYRFKLQSDASPDRLIVVRVPDLAAVREARRRTTAKVLARLEATLETPSEFAALKALPLNASAEGGERVVNLVVDTIGGENPDLTEVAKYLLAAELMDQVNWHNLAAQALHEAVRVEPEIATVPSYGRLLARTREQSDEVGPGEQPALPHAVLGAASPKTPFTQNDARKSARKVADLMRKVPVLAPSAKSLAADLKVAEGKTREAARIYRELPQSTSVAQRLKATQ